MQEDSYAGRVWHTSVHQDMFLYFSQINMSTLWKSLFFFLHLVLDQFLSSCVQRTTLVMMIRSTSAADSEPLPDKASFMKSLKSYQWQINHWPILYRSDVRYSFFLILLHLITMWTSVWPIFIWNTLQDACTKTHPETTDCMTAVINDLYLLRSAISNS